MFTNDLFSSLPTDNQDAKTAYRAYWTIATSDDNAVANSTAPIYRFARDYMLRAVMRDYGLTVAEAAWLYDNVLPEGPGWGDLDSMVRYGRTERFGIRSIAEAVANCYAAHDDPQENVRAHSIDCPFRDHNSN